MKQKKIIYKYNKIKIKINIELMGVVLNKDPQKGNF